MPRCSTASRSHFEPGAADLTYRVALEYGNGRVAEHEVFAPNRLRTNHLDQVDLTPTGWLKVTGAPDGGSDLDGPLETENEQVFHEVMDAVAAHGWPESEPYAETLAIDVTIPGIERALDYGDEVMSTREALHEDFYFSLLEFFKRRSGRPPEDRSLQPGQIVPDIRAGEGDAHVRVTLRPFGVPTDPVRPEQDIETADAAPGLAQIQRELAALPGETFEGISREGRPVRGIYRPGSRPAVLVTGGQHANETSAPVGALRAVRRLLANPEANIAYIPGREPGRLCPARPALRGAIRAICIMPRATPRSAATWNTAATNLSMRSAPATRRWRCRARSCISTCTAIRRMNGRGLSRATCRAASSSGRSRRASSSSCAIIPSWAETARTLIEAVTKGLAAVPGLAEFNRRQIEICSIHSGGTPYEIINDVPCLLTPDERHPTPLTLITEFPDETIYGDAYRFAHTVQMATVIAAEEAFASIMAQVA